MGKLFVANVTPQSRVVTWRLDFIAPGQSVDKRMLSNFRQVTIPPGRQVVVGGDLPTDSLSELVDQLTLSCAMCGQVDVPNRLHGTFHPLVFNIDRPVTEKAMRAVIAHNSQVQSEDGRVRRQKASVAANVAIDNVLASARIPTQTTKSLDVEYEQETISEALEPGIAEGYHVDLTPYLGGGKPSAGGRGPRRAAVKEHG